MDCCWFLLKIRARPAAPAASAGLLHGWQHCGPAGHARIYPDAGGDRERGAAAQHRGRGRQPWGHAGAGAAARRERRRGGAGPADGRAAFGGRGRWALPPKSLQPASPSPSWCSHLWLLQSQPVLCGTCERLRGIWSCRHRTFQYVLFVAHCYPRTPRSLWFSCVFICVIVCALFQRLPDSTGWGCQPSVPGASAPCPVHCLLQDGLTQKDTCFPGNTKLSDRVRPRVSYRSNRRLAGRLTVLLWSQNVFGLWSRLCSFYPQIYKIIYTMFALSSYCLFKIRKLSCGEKKKPILLDRLVGLR